MQQITHITRDISINGVPPVVPAKQGDTARVIVAKLLDNGVAYTIPADAVAIMRAAKPDGTGCYYDDGVTISGNEISIPIVEQVLTAAGMVRAEINLYNAGGDKLTSFSWCIDVEKSVINDATIISSDYFNALTETASQILTAGMKIQVLGYYANLAALETAVTNPNAGDVYGLTDDANYDFVIYDGVSETWVDAGAIEGTPGPTGPAGPTGPTGPQGKHQINVFSVDPLTGMLSVTQSWSDE